MFLFTKKALRPTKDCKIGSGAKVKVESADSPIRQCVTLCVRAGKLDGSECCYIVSGKVTTEVEALSWSGSRQLQLSRI